MRSPALSDDVLAAITERLRADETVISPYAVAAEASPALGALVAAGRRASIAPGEYAAVVESVREGYLLHYGAPRVVAPPDRDLALLAGDYLYAIGIDRLARLGDLQAIRELADLISLCAEVHAAERPPGAQRTASALWLACACALAAEPEPGYRRAKERVRAGDPDMVGPLLDAAVAMAAKGGLSEPLGAAAETVGFRRRDLPQARATRAGLPDGSGDA